MTAAPLSGRRAQAARNDELILEAAREVFVADPTAPIASVAERAGVGISALYRRYGGKEDMLRRLCADGLSLYIRIAETALASTDPPWETFVAFARAVVAADTHTDFGLLFEQLSSVRRGSAERTAELRERYLALLLDSLRTPPQHVPLPGPPPLPGEFSDRWEKR
jgi:AcrR family transcriptional regulator